MLSLPGGNSYKWHRSIGRVSWSNPRVQKESCRPGQRNGERGKVRGARRGWDRERPWQDVGPQG